MLAGRLAAGDPFTHALITLDAAAVLPEDLVPEGAVATTRSYLEKLGADALLARMSRVDVDLSCAGGAPAHRPPRPTRTCDLPVRLGLFSTCGEADSPARSVPQSLPGPSCVANLF